jgi:hypothetical protein
VAATAPATRPVTRLRPLAERLVVPRVLLPLAFALSAAWLAWQAGHVESFVWMIDEGLYAKEAQAYADLQGLLPHVHGHRHGVPNVLYPMLMAPLYAVFSAPDAFTAAHVLNALLWASTLFPVYLLARRVGTPWPWALLAGVLSVWVPWAVAVTVVMTEAVSYVAFAWAVYAMTVAVASPRPRNDALALLAILVTISARTQFVFLLAAFVIALVVHALAVRDSPWWRRLRDHWVVGALFAAGALGVFAITLADSQFLGGYGVVTGLPLFPGGMWNAAGLHLGHVVVGVGILPAILYVAWLFGVASDRPSASGPLAFAVVGTVTLALLIYQAAFFMQNVGAVLQERYVSYAAPILFVGMVALAAQRHRVAPRLAILVGGVVAAAAVAGAPHNEAEAGNAFDTVSNGSAAYIFRLGPWLVDLFAPLPGRDFSTGEALVTLTLVLGVVAAVAFATRARRWAVPVLCLLVLAFTADATRFVVKRAVLGINSGFPYSLAGAREIPKKWVDRATPDDAVVGLQVGLLGVPDEQNQWLWTDFWNESIQRSYSFDGTMGYSGWPGDRWALDKRDGSLRTAEPPDYLVASQIDPELRVHGEIVAHSSYNAVVIKPASPLRAKWAVDQSNAPGAPIRIYAYPARPGEVPPPVEVTLSIDAVGPEHGKVVVPYTIDDGDTTRRGRLAAGEQRKVVVRPATRALGPAVAKITQTVQPLTPEGESVVEILSITEPSA